MFNSGCYLTLLLFLIVSDVEPSPEVGVQDQYTDLPYPPYTKVGVQDQYTDLPYPPYTKVGVQDQYTDLPYPPYTKGDEIQERMAYLEHTLCYKGKCDMISNNNTKNGPYSLSLELDVLNAYLYEEKQSFENFTVLIVGGGTGFTASHLGERLKQKNPEIVYLDFSAASMRVAQKRVNMRGVTGIKWLNDRIENIPNLGLGKFDLIQCSGVLHHLPSPQHGLNILSESLAEDGGMAIMVYAKTARTGIYQIQQLLRFVNEGIVDKEAEIQNMWTLLHSFDIRHLERRMKSNPKKSISYFFRAIQMGRVRDWDIEAYDRLCHKQDRAYTVPELFEFIEKAGLEFVALTSPEAISILTIDDAVNFGTLDEELKSLLKLLSPKEQMTVADIVDGTVPVHEFYARKRN